MVSSCVRECGTTRVVDGGKLVVVSSGNSVMTASWIFSIFADETVDQSFLILDHGGSCS
jgi:hypothetical protein